MAKKEAKDIEIVNRRARFEYHFDSKYEAGIKLTGTEVKSIRMGQANLSDAYCVFEDGELYVVSMFISEYKYANQFNHETRRKRKLLLKKNQLRKLEKKVKERGFTIVPYRLYFNDRNFVKVEIALAQGKKTYDKRQSIKEKDAKRDLARIKKVNI